MKEEMRAARTGAERGDDACVLGSPDHEGLALCATRREKVEWSGAMAAHAEEREDDMRRPLEAGSVLLPFIVARCGSARAASKQKGPRTPASTPMAPPA